MAQKGEALIHVPKGLGFTLATLKGARTSFIPVSRPHANQPSSEFGLAFLWEQADLSRMSDHDNDVAVQQHFLTVLIVAIRRCVGHTSIAICLTLLCLCEPNPRAPIPLQ